jgi:predicted methyltransferase
LNKFKLIPLALAAGAFAAFMPPPAHATDAAAIQYAGPMPEAQLPKYVTDAVNSPDRPAEDKKLDESRRPEQLMAFFGIRPGMRVADMWAGGGYTTELLARIAGPSGKVYSQNAPFPEKFKQAEQAWKARVKEPGLANVTEVIANFGTPEMLPVKPGTLDAVVINLNYHDLVGRGYDRAKFNSAIFRDLKRGGIYCTADNSAQAGTGPRDAGTLHRIGESFEIREIEAAGFRLAASSVILRNPKDDRTLPFWKMNRMQDRFVLRFVKP